MYQMEEEKMKHKVIVAMSLVVAGVMTYLMFSGLDEGFYHFPCLLYTSPSPRDRSVSRMPSSA